MKAKAILETIVYGEDITALRHFYETILGLEVPGVGIEGSDESWAEPFPEAPPRLRTREQLAADVEWARRYFAPWLGRGIRRIPHGSGLTAKRPVLTPVPKQWS